jgi:hypothetical protein
MQTSELHNIHPTVSQWIAAFNAHDVTALVALYEDKATLFDSGMPRPRRGHNEITRWFTWRFRSTPTISYTPQGTHSSEDGEQVTITWIARGHGPRFLGQSWLSHPFEVKGQSEFTLHEYLIVRQQGTYDHLSVLRQVLPPLRWLPRFVASTIYALYLWRNGFQG